MKIGLENTFITKENFEIKIAGTRNSVSSGNKQ